MTRNSLNYGLRAWQFEDLRVGKEEKALIGLNICESSRAFVQGVPHTKLQPLKVKDAEEVGG